MSASYDDPRLRPQSCKGDDGHDSDDDLGHTPAARERSVLNALRRSIPKNAAKKVKSDFDIDTDIDSKVDFYVAIEH